MTKTTINLILLSLVSVLAVACGDPGGADFEDDFALDPEAGQPDGVGPDFGGADEEPRGEELVAPPVEFDQFVEGGSGEPVGPEDVEPIGGTPTGFAEPGIYEAKIEVKVHFVSTLPGGTSRVDTCEASLALDVGSSTATAGGSCLIFNGILEYALIVDLVDDERVEGELYFMIDGVSNTVPLGGTLNDSLLSLEFDGVTLAAPNVRGVWIGTVVAELR